MTSPSNCRLWSFGAPGIALGLTMAIGGTSVPLPSAATARAQGRTVWDRVYSRAQSARGEAAYKLSCGYCHKDDLSGGFMDDGVGRAVPLAGPHAFNSTFEARWKDQTLGDMVYAIASTMPKESPTSLPLSAYVDIVTFLLDRNGVPAGETDLPADVSTLRAIAITPASH
ncbi:MAG: hypothetical protein FJW27_08810 [Acidimicrobiia bacterium]|nr:hypothetical protein [Acidimicrobiia bacterium]